MLRRSFLLALAIGPVLAACGDGTGPDDVAGVYTLRTANGMPVPAVVAEADGRTTEILEGELTLTADGYFESKVVFRYTDESSVHVDEVAWVGTYTLDGDVINVPFDHLGPNDPRPVIVRSPTHVTVVFPLTPLPGVHVFYNLVYRRR